MELALIRARAPPQQQASSEGGFAEGCCPAVLPWQGRVSRLEKTKGAFALCRRDAQGTGKHGWVCASSTYTWPSCSSPGEGKAEGKGSSAFTFSVIRGRQSTFDPKSLQQSLHTSWHSLPRLGEMDPSCSGYWGGGRIKASAPSPPLHHVSSGAQKSPGTALGPTSSLPLG